MRRILGLMICIFVLFSGNCFAMQFSQPVEIGRIYHNQTGYGGISVINATYNNGNYFTEFNKNNTRTYEKGIAQYGNNEDPLYVHYGYRDGPFKFGGKNINNTIPDSFIGGFDIFRINTNEKITIYALSKIYSAEFDYLVIGRRADGKFVRYIDTREITQRYFGWDGKHVSPVAYVDLFTQYNTLIMKYHRGGYKQLIEGTFYFKWDDNAQWFGVEQGTESVIRSW